MSDPPTAEPTPLESFRPFLGLLARLRIGRRLRGHLDPSDLVQQTLLRAHQTASPPDGDDDGRRAAWLRRILERTLLDEVRRVTRVKRGGGAARSLAAAIDESSSRLETFLAAPDLSPSQVAEGHERLIRLAQALEELSNDQRQAVELHYLKGWTLAEVGRELGRSKAAVAGLLRRGLRKLRGRLEPDKAD